MIFWLLFPLYFHRHYYLHYLNQVSHTHKHGKIHGKKWMQFAGIPYSDPGRERERENSFESIFLLTL